MYLPKQSIPILRNLNSVSVSHDHGVNPSLGRTEFNRLFNRRGTCTCRDTGTIFLSDAWILPENKNNKCNRGFTPKCDPYGGCRCEDSRQVIDGRVRIPYLEYIKRY